MIEHILKFFLTELKRMETHYDKQMKGFGNKIKTQRAELIKYNKSFKKNKVNCKYREFCIKKDGIIKELKDKVQMFIGIEANLCDEIKVLHEEREKLVKCSSKFGLEEVNELGRIRDNIVPTAEDKKILIGMVGVLQGEVRDLAQNPDRPYDDPESDSTEFAHPAWWRGERYSYVMMCERINEFLDGKGNQGTCHKELEEIKIRIKDLLVEKNMLHGVLVKDDDDWELCETYKAEIKVLEEELKDLGQTHVGMHKNLEKLQNTITSLRTASKFKKEYDPKWEKAYRDMKNQRDKLGDIVSEQKDKICTLYNFIKHGDEKHQEWLKDMIAKHFGLEDIANSSKVIHKLLKDKQELTLNEGTRGYQIGYQDGFNAGVVYNALHNKDKE